MSGDPGAVQPALSAEEWEQPQICTCAEIWEPDFPGDDQDHWDYRLVDGSLEVFNSEWNDWSLLYRRHAVAALALHGQPFGFERADTRALRGWAQIADAQRCHSDGDRLRSLAARIEALLPPEEK